MTMAVRLRDAVGTTIRRGKAGRREDASILPPSPGADFRESGIRSRARTEDLRVPRVVPPRGPRPVGAPAPARHDALPDGQPDRRPFEGAHGDHGPGGLRAESSRSRRIERLTRTSCQTAIPRITPKARPISRAANP